MKKLFKKIFPNAGFNNLQKETFKKNMKEANQILRMQLIAIIIAVIVLMIMY